MEDSKAEVDEETVGGEEVSTCAPLWRKPKYTILDVESGTLAGHGSTGDFDGSES